MVFDISLHMRDINKFNVILDKMGLGFNILYIPQGTCIIKPKYFAKYTLTQMLKKVSY